MSATGPDKPSLFSRLGVFFGHIPRRTRIMGGVTLALAAIAITLEGSWGEVGETIVLFGVIGLIILVVGFVAWGLSKIVGEKAATWITSLLILGALGGCVGFVVSNWGY